VGNEVTASSGGSSVQKFTNIDVNDYMTVTPTFGS
jgi:hypothetical protein